MSTVPTCGCGDVMSRYEYSIYGRCTDCQNKANKEAKAALEAKRIEDEARELRLKQEKLEQTKTQWTDRLGSMIGHTITGATVTEWSLILGEYAPVEATLETLSGMSLLFKRYETSDGCRGYYDYYHSLSYESYGQPYEAYEMSNEEAVIHLLSKRDIKKESLSREELEILFNSMESVLKFVDLELQRKDREEDEQKHEGTTEANSDLLPPQT